MNIKCPHCGTEYEVEKKDMYRYTKCLKCGKGFVIGQLATTQKKNGVTQGNQATSATTAVNENEDGSKFDVVDIAQRKLLVDGVGGVLNFKINLLSWFRICFHHWKLKHVSCPNCKSDKVVCSSQNEQCEFKCDSCGELHSVIDGETQRRKNLGAYRQTYHNVQSRYKNEFTALCMRQDAVCEQLRICELRNVFFEQASIFECDWDAYGDDALPKRLQFIIDGLRAKIANAHSSVVASAVAHAAATNQAYGTTVGLRNPNSGMYLIARDIVQEGGWNKMVAADKQLRLLNSSIEELTASLSYYESLMLYYYDLCEEFRGKDKETARRDRLWTRCNYPDEDSLPLVEDGKSEAMLLKEQNNLKDQKLRIQHEAEEKIGYIERELGSSLIEKSMFRLWSCALMAIIAVLLPIGYVVHEAFASKVSLSGTIVQTGNCILTRDLLAKALASPNLTECYISEPDVILSQPHKFVMENELSGWSKIDHDVKVRVVQVFRGEGVVVSAKWDKYVLAFVKSTCKYSLGETIQPGVYIPCGKATFKNSAGVKTTVPAFLQLNPAEAKHMVQKLVSELDKEADKRVKNAEEAKRIEAKRRTAKLDYDAKVAKAKLEAEAEAARLRAKEEEERLLLEKKRNQAEELARELESRKDTCVMCNGDGVANCARCKGAGEIIVRETEPCTTCANDESGFSSSHQRGCVKKQVDCSNCRGRGEIVIRPRCQFCGGKGFVKITEPGRFARKERCSNCRGSGKADGYFQACGNCSGAGKVEIEQSCFRCGGRGVIATSSKVTCPVCDGKCRLKCERCGGRGFTYRPKQ